MDMDVEPVHSIFPFLQLPRELRDQIYSHVLAIPDPGDRALRIERRHLKHFKPSAASILLVLHHEYFLINRQICREALQVLFKHHTVFLSCGPYVLKQLLTRIEQGPLKQYLAWIKKIELDWETFPNLRAYPPERSEGRDEWWWESDDVEVDVDYIRGGAQHSGNYDEYDYEGGHYDDNFYEADDDSLYPPWPHSAANGHGSSTTNNDDSFGLATHYPFAHPVQGPTADTDTNTTTNTTANNLDTKLDLLVSMEVTPLFDYLATPTLFTLTSITLPLHFISKQPHHHRTAVHPGHTLPVKIRYWVQVCVHALLMLRKSSPSSSPSSSAPSLSQVRIKYVPWDIWASMNPTDNLTRMVEQGVFFRPSEDDDDRAGEGEAFRAVWHTLAERHGLCSGEDRMGLRADVRLVKWEGDLDRWRVGDELEIVFWK